MADPQVPDPTQALETMGLKYAAGMPAAVTFEMERQVNIKRSARLDERATFFASVRDLTEPRLGIVDVL